MPRQWQPYTVVVGQAIASPQVTINVYVHVISTGPNLGDGNVPDQWVAAQINTMNKAYIATGFQVRGSGSCRPLSPSTSVVFLPPVPAGARSVHTIAAPAASTMIEKVLNKHQAWNQAACVPSQFALVNISRTVNPTWYNMAPQSSDELAAKTLLHTGNMRGARLCC